MSKVSGKRERERGERVNLSKQKSHKYENAIIEFTRTIFTRVPIVNPPAVHAALLLCFLYLPLAHFTWLPTSLAY